MIHAVLFKKFPYNEPWGGVKKGLKKYFDGGRFLTWGFQFLL